VDGRRPRARVEFRLDPRHLEIGQPDPFPPTGDRE
jgi:hypothetical protein